MPHKFQCISRLQFKIDLLSGTARQIENTDTKFYQFLLQFRYGNCGFRNPVYNHSNLQGMFTTSYHNDCDILRHTNLPYRYHTTEHCILLHTGSNFFVQLGRRIQIFYFVNILEFKSNEISTCITFRNIFCCHIAEVLRSNCQPTASPE